MYCSCIRLCHVQRPLPPSLPPLHIFAVTPFLRKYAKNRPAIISSAPWLPTTWRAVVGGYRVCAMECRVCASDIKRRDWVSSLRDGVSSLRLREKGAPRNSAPVMPS